MKKILLSTDFSEESLLGIEFAKTFIKSLSAVPELTLLHVVDYIPSSRLYYGLGIDTENVFLNCEEEAKKMMEGLIQKNFFDQENVLGVIKRGSKSVASEIITILKDGKYDLFITARKGQTALAHALFGSVSEYVVRYAPCPVVVVPARFKE